MIQHPTHPERFYLSSHEVERLWHARDVNWKAIAHELGISDTALYKKRNGRSPFTMAQFQCVLAHTGLSWRDVVCDEFGHILLEAS